MFGARLTGVQIGPFGKSWEYVPTDLDIAKDLIRFGNSKRVLFNPYDAEVPDACEGAARELKREIYDRLRSPASPSSTMDLQAAYLTDALNGLLDAVPKPGLTGAVTPTERLLFAGSLGVFRCQFGVIMHAWKAGLNLELGKLESLPNPNFPLRPARTG